MLDVPGGMALRLRLSTTRRMDAMEATFCSGTFRTVTSVKFVERVNDEHPFYF